METIQPVQRPSWAAILKAYAEVIFLLADVSNKPTVSAEDVLEDTKENSQGRKHGKREESITKVNR